MLIEPVALPIDIDVLIRRNGVDQFNPEGFALIAENFLRFVARPHFLGEGFVARDDLAHLFFDGGKIFRCERFIAEEVVVETTVDHRTDRHLRPGPERLHCIGEYVGSVVANEFKCARVIAVEELDFGVARNLVCKVHDRAVQRHRNGALGQGRRNALGDIEARNVF